MCLGVPGLVVEVDEPSALVDCWGVRRRVRLDLADEPVSVDDDVRNHVGFVIRRIPSGDAQTTPAMYEELIRSNTGCEPADRMAADTLFGHACVPGAGGRLHGEPRTRMPHLARIRRTS
jgi:hydrogenase assembly chaperone HypC/HupF